MIFDRFYAVVLEEHLPQRSRRTRREIIKIRSIVFNVKEEILSADFADYAEKICSICAICG